MRFEWDERKSEKTKAERGFDFEHAATVFADRYRIDGPGRTVRGEQRDSVIGSAVYGDILLVVYTWREHETRNAAASSRRERLVVKSEEDIRAYAKSPEAKAASKRLRAHLAKHRGEPSREDLAEIAELTDEELAALRPVKEQLSIRLDRDIIDWLKSQPGAYQTRLNNILRAVMIRQREHAEKR